MRSELSLYFSRLNPLVMSLSTNQKSRDIGLLLQQVTTYDLYSEESNLVIIFLKYTGDLSDKGMYLLYNNNVHFVTKQNRLIGQ